MFCESFVTGRSVCVRVCEYVCVYVCVRVCYSCVSPVCSRVCCMKEVSFISFSVRLISVIMNPENKLSGSDWLTQWRVWTNFTLKQVSGRNQRLLINLWWIFVLWVFLIFFLQFKDKQLLFTNNFCLSVSQIFTIKALCQSNHIWHMLIYLFMELVIGNFAGQVPLKYCVIFIWGFWV